jgi:predicted GIY-YIG superfamily endonuclease
MQYLYRAFDSQNQLLYVGISNQWHHRLHQHEKSAAWIEQADYVKIERFSDRESVSVAEREAVKTEKPLHNKVFNEDYEAALAHWKKIKRWIKTGHAPDESHQYIVDVIRDCAKDLYQNNPNTVKSEGMAFLFLEIVEALFYQGFEPCRNCAGVWNSSTIQVGHAVGKAELLKNRGNK